jgi:hypothetical protein
MHKVKRSLQREWNASEVIELFFNDAERTCLYKIVQEGKKECLDDIFAFQNLSNILLIKGQGQTIEIFELHPNSFKKLNSTAITMEKVRFDKQISLPGLESVAGPATFLAPPPELKPLTWYNKKIPVLFYIREFNDIYQTVSENIELDEEARRYLTKAQKVLEDYKVQPQFLYATATDYGPEINQSRKILRPTLTILSPHKQSAIFDFLHGDTVKEVVNNKYGNVLIYTGK